MHGYFLKNIGIILRTNFDDCTQKVVKPLSKEKIAKTSDFKNVGLTNYDIAKLCKDDVIEKIQNGFYQLPNNYNISEEQLISNLYLMEQFASNRLCFIMDTVTLLQENRR